MEPRYPAVGALTSCLCGGGAASHLRGGRIYQFTCQQRRNATGASLTLAASDTHRRLRTLARPLADPSFPSSLLDHFPNIGSIAVIGPAPDSDIDLSALSPSRYRGGIGRGRLA